MIAPASLGGSILVVILQNAISGALQIVELPGPERPQEPGKADEAEEQRDGNEPGKSTHGASLMVMARNRTAFAVTRIEEVDIATAAIRGVTKPAAAIGTKIRL